MSNEPAVIQAYQAGGFQLNQVFSDKEAAQAWARAEDHPAPTIYEVPSDSEREGSSYTPPSRQRHSSKHPKSKKGPTRQRSPSPSYSSDPSSSSSGDSSSSDSDSSLSSSDSSSLGGRRQPSSRKRTKKKKSKKKKKKKDKNKSQKQSSIKHGRGSPSLLHGPDPSTGTKGFIYNKELNDDKLLKKLGPPEMKIKDIHKLFEVGIDVVGLPGMFRAQMDDQLADMERMQMDLTGLLRAGLGRGSQPEMTDTLWRSQQKHQLGKVKTFKQFANLLSDIEEVEEQAFEQQGNLIRLFMSGRGYSTKEITAYLQQGGLPLIIHSTFKDYLGLLNTVRQKHFEGGMEGDWGQGHANGLLSYHASKLLALRTTSYNKTNFILRVYAYLRDAKATQYHHPSMIKYLWKEVSALKQPVVKGKGEGKAVVGTPERCNHCRSNRLHNKYRLPLDKDHCPFKDESQAKARRAAQKAHSILDDEPNLSKGDLVRQALAES